MIPCDVHMGAGHSSKNGAVHSSQIVYSASSQNGAVHSSLKGAASSLETNAVHS